MEYSAYARMVRGKVWDLAREFGKQIPDITDEAVRLYYNAGRAADDAARSWFARTLS